MVDAVLIVVPRNEWKALPPKCVNPLKTHPLKYLWITFTDTPECFNREDCIKAMQELQKRDMEEGLSDIRYNFLLGGDARVYEARGWHTNNEGRGHKYYDRIDGNSVDIAYIGPQPVPNTRNYPALRVKQVRDMLVDYGLKNQLISPGFNERKA